MTPKVILHASPQKLGRLVESVRRALEDRANNGDADAARELLHLSMRAVRSVEWLNENKESALREIVKVKAEWPVIFPANAKRRTALIEKMKDLGLGTKSMTNVRGKFGMESPISKALLSVAGLIFSASRGKKPIILVPPWGGPFTKEQQNDWEKWLRLSAKKLPRTFTRENAKKWAEITTPLLVVFWGKDFEQHSVFSICRKNSERENATPGKIRDKIRKLWRQTWKSYANPELSRIE